jgi:hypothetical protein
MIDRSNFYKIAKFNIGEDASKRVEIFYDIKNNIIEFVGYSARKTDEIVKQWKECVTREINFKNNITYKFEDVIQEIYEEILEKEKTLETLKKLFENVDSVDIKSEED